MSDRIGDLIEGLQAQRLDRRQFLRRAVLLGMSAGAANALLAACAPAAPSPTAAPAKPGESKPDANALDKIVEAAKKEGEVSLLEAVSKPDTQASIAAGFKKKWGLPDSFKITHTVKQTGQLVSGLAAELKSGKVSVDIFWVVGVDPFKEAKQAGELLAYEPTEYKSKFQPNVDKMQLESNVPYWYPAQFYVFQPVWNRKKIKKELTSWQDIVELGPEYKGRIIVSDVRVSASALDTYVGTRRVLDLKYFEKLKEYQPALMTRIDDQVQKMVSGEADIQTTGTNSRAYQWSMNDKSLELGVVWPKEGLVPLPAFMAILAKAPHPNAAKLMVEYLLSQESMQHWANAEAQWPLRSDYKIEGELAKFMKPADQITFISVPWAKITKQDRDQSVAEFRKIFGD